MDVRGLLLKFTESVACDKIEDISQKLKNQEGNEYECIYEYYKKKQ